jgi:type VI protein secretion system component VasK
MTVATLVLTLPVAYLAFRVPYVPRPTVIMLAFILIALSIAGVVGATGRIIDNDPDADRVVRIILISLRFFVIGGLITVTHELWVARRLPPLRRRSTDEEAK